jgi:phospholipase/carboxylesterase
VEWNFPPDAAAMAAAVGRTDRPPCVSFSTGTHESGQASVDYAISVPRSYAPGYAYPLIVWFHEEGSDEREVLEWVPRISPQNYLGLGLRGPLPIRNGLPEQRTWSTGPQHLEWLEDQLTAALVDVFEDWSIHPHRIVAAGIGRGGTLALQMFLRRPDLFAGAACLNADLLPDFRLDWWGQYSGRGLWLGHSDLLAEGHRRPALMSARTLHAAGINVHPRRYSLDEWPLETMGRDIDHWLLRTFCGETVIV